MNTDRTRVRVDLRGGFASVVSIEKAKCERDCACARKFAKVVWFVSRG